MDASLCGVLRAFLGDFLSLLSGMKLSVPLAVTIATFLAVMIDLLFRAWVQSAPRACTPARRRDRGSKGKGGRGGGGSPGLHKRFRWWRLSGLDVRAEG